MSNKEIPTTRMILNEIKIRLYDLIQLQNSAYNGVDRTREIVSLSHAYFKIYHSQDFDEVTNAN